MSAYAFIPARGGSKGVPGKNLALVGGRPLVARAVDAAQAAQLVDLVVVSTDDPAIAEVARDAGALVVDRPSNLGVDTATSESALLHALDALNAAGRADPDVTVLVQCTSPFTSAADISGVIAAIEQGADCAFTGARTHAFHWHAGDGGATPVNHEASSRPRRQDRRAEYVETGGAYGMRTAGFRTAGHRFFGRVEVVEVSAAPVLEIDAPADLELARALAPVVDAKRRRGHLPATVTGLALDFDGVLTDNTVVTSQDGTEAVVSSRSDGLGLDHLRAAGLPVVVLSKEQNPVVAARCRKLRLECVQGVDDKRSAFAAWMDGRGLDPAGVVFLGNDANDVECLVLAGCGAVVADAHDSARQVADLVLSRPGGRGAVRELADLIVERVGSA